MATVHGIHGSETLNTQIFDTQPRSTELWKKIEEMLAQLSPNQYINPIISEKINNICALSDTLEWIAWETRNNLVSLYVETVTERHIGEYKTKVTLLEEHQRTRVAEVLRASDSTIMTT
jgi:hypothetical protein